MWKLDNQTPFQAERTWVREKDGKHYWIVVVKATYNIAVDGTLTLSDEPVEPFFTPEYKGTVGESSIRYEADLIAMKPATDVYINGIAFAPQGNPTIKVKVSFHIDQLRKELLVYGNRTWTRSLIGDVTLSSPEHFVTMPITYERAFGGFDREDPNPEKHRIDFRNPVGSGFAYRKSHLFGKPAPNVETQNQKQGKGWPAGFGAIASYWSPRKELAGTYDKQWEEKRKPLLPADYDPKFLLCAPLDQQIPGYLKGGNRIEMINMTPSGLLRFNLPRISYQYETHFGKNIKKHDGELVSVIVESEGPRLIMIWQTSLECGNDGEYLDKTVIQHWEQYA